MAADGFISIDLTLATAKARQKLLQFKTAAVKAAKDVEAQGDNSSGVFAKSWEGASDRTKAAFKKAGTAARAIGKAAAAGCTVGATAIATITKQASDNYSTYEQLAGGMQKIFGDAYSTVAENAQGAFETANMSANEYMQNATLFGSALVSSMGDTQEAAEKTDQVMTQIADNENMFGTSNIADVYKALAKQNYTMLDNLQLSGESGFYGGNAEGMVKLIKDTGVLGDEADKLTNKNINSMVTFDQMVDAIGIAQKKMNITGTTIKESAGTMEGSTKMLKASWENWLTELAKEDGDLAAVTQDLTDSAAAAFTNLVPRVVTTLTALAPAISEQLPTLIEQIGTALEENDTVNQLGEAGMKAFKTMLDFIGENIDPEDIDAFIGDVAGFLQTEGDPSNNDSLASKLGDIGFKLISGVAQGVRDNGGELLNAVIDAAWNALDMGIAAAIAGFTGTDVEGNGLQSGERKGYTMHSDGSVTWHANGGVYDKPTIVGVGEAGKEAIMPLRSSTYDEMARGIQRAGGTGAIDYDRLGEAVGKHVGSIRAYVSASDIDGAMGRRRNYANRGLAQ